MKRTSSLLAPLFALGCTAGGVPDNLLDIEGDAEDAYDKALVEDYAAVADDADRIDSAWQAYRDTAAADGASDTTLTRFDDAIAGLYVAAEAGESAAIVGRAANAVSAPMPDLFDLYDPNVPATVLALDYEGREVVLDGVAVDFTAASDDVEALAATWQDVRQQVLDAGGSTEAKDFDASVDRLSGLAAGSDATALIEEANANLELVDVLEGVFGG